jgi:hypothetical protein
MSGNICGLTSNTDLNFCDFYMCGLEDLRRRQEDNINIEL